jgi:hypothetical protein
MKYCFEVQLETTNSTSNCAWVGPPEKRGTIGVGQYIETENGTVYAIAGDIQHVAEKYPNAVRITRIGLAGISIGD